MCRRGSSRRWPRLTRTRDCVEAEGGRFIDARFEADDPEVRKFFEEHSWSWNDNPFLGTRELSGLKIVMMLLSNWDSKDRRDVARGSNTAIFEQRVGRWPRVRREAHYLLTDWGGAMGKWGSNIVTRGRWDVDGFEAQTPQFVTGVKDGRVVFGYAGQRTADIAGDIPVEHARWFHGYASRIGERQLVEGLLASGATDDEANRFARAMVERISQLGRVLAETESRSYEARKSSDVPSIRGLRSQATFPRDLRISLRWDSSTCSGGCCGCRCSRH